MATLKVSPLAPANFPTLPAVAGVSLAAVEANIKYKGRTDVMVAELCPGTQVAGVVTRSLTCSAPVDWCKHALKGGTARVLIVNSGNANAFTGKKGEASVKRTVTAAAELFGCAPEQVFVSSTGVIGEPIADDRITNALPAAKAKLSPDNLELAARAIMTTDTFAKGSARTVMIEGTKVVLSGIAKGSGMIAPDMATMLGYVFTDAAISAPVLQALLAPATDRSFNSVTVDSDTSTSDTCLLFATGKAGNRLITEASDPALADFARALDEVMQDLAMQLVRDGEGATKFVTVTVNGAEHDQAARRIALAIANSPLVKTAIAGEDANWGRIVMAVGKAGERADRDKLKIELGGITLAQDGERVDDYNEAPVAAHMKGQEIDIRVHVGIANGSATVWTCDLTHGYIDINADYRS